MSGCFVAAAAASSAAGRFPLSAGSHQRVPEPGRLGARPSGNGKHGWSPTTPRFSGSCGRSVAALGGKSLTSSSSEPRHIPRSSRRFTVLRMSPACARISFTSSRRTGLPAQLAHEFWTRAPQPSDSIVVDDLISAVLGLAYACLDPISEEPDTAFVAMPFAEPFAARYGLLYVPLLRELGYRPCAPGWRRLRGLLGPARHVDQEDRRLARRPDRSEPQTCSTRWDSPRD